jgi:hypothetical protein
MVLFSPERTNFMKIIEKIKNLLTSSYHRRELKWDIICYFRPRQQWLVDKLPRQFCDKVELIPLVMFEMLIHFVEDEEGLDGIWGPHYEESDTWKSIREPVRKELEDAYNYIKTDRPLLQKELDESYPEALDGGSLLDHVDPVIQEDGKIKHYTMRSCEQIYGMSYEEAYGEVHRLEKLIFERDTETMMTIIKHREYLWT